MTDWPAKTLGEVAVVGAGNSAPQDKKLFKNGVHRFVRTSDVGQVRIGRLDQSADLLNDEGTKGLRMFRAGVTLMPKSGASTFLNHRVQLTKPCFVSSHLAVVDPNPKLMDDTFMFYFLQTVRSQDLIQDQSYPSLNLPAISGINVLVPPLEEQKRIVELLDAATARVAEITACYEKARAHANDLFASALRDAVESNPDWPVKTLGEVATFHNGRAYKQQELLDKGKYRVLRVGNFFSSKSWYWSDLELDEHKYCDKGDLLYAWSASFGPRIWDEEKVIYHYHIWKVVEDSQQVDRQFLKYWLEEDVERVKSASGTGTTMMHVSKGNIEARLISLPPLEEQKQIVARLDSMKAKTSEMVAAYDAKLTAAKNLRQSILEAAFAGDL